MSNKSFHAIIVAGVISLALTGCGSLDILVPPQAVGDGAQLEGPIAAGPGWQPYNNTAPPSHPVPSSPDPGWRSAAASDVVRAAPLEPATRAVAIDPSFSETRSVRNRIDHLRRDESSWGTYSGAGNVTSASRSYSSRPDRLVRKSSIYSPWADRIIASGEKAAFERMVMEATRTGGSRLTLRDGRHLSADRLDTAANGCTTVAVKASSSETTPPFSSGEATVCGR